MNWLADDFKNSIDRVEFEVWWDVRDDDQGLTYHLLSKKTENVAPYFALGDNNGNPKGISIENAQVHFTTDSYLKSGTKLTEAVGFSFTWEADPMYICPFKFYD